MPIVFPCSEFNCALFSLSAPLILALPSDAAPLNMEPGAGALPVSALPTCIVLVDVEKAFDGGECFEGVGAFHENPSLRLAWTQYSTNTIIIS